MLGVQRIAVTIQTADLVDTGMYLVRVEDRLLRLVTLLATQADSAFHYPVTTQHEQDEDHKGDVSFISVERHRLGSWDAFFIVGEFLQAALDLEQHKHDHSKNQRQDTIEQRVVARCVLCSGSFSATTLGSRGR